MTWKLPPTVFLESPTIVPECWLTSDMFVWEISSHKHNKKTPQDLHRSHTLRMVTPLYPTTPSHKTNTHLHTITQGHHKTVIAPLSNTKKYSRGLYDPSWASKLHFQCNKKEQRQNHNRLERKKKRWTVKQGHKFVHRHLNRCRNCMRVVPYVW